MKNNNENPIEKSEIHFNSRGLELRNLEDMYRFGQYLQKSGLAPSSFKSPEQILIAIQCGAELGMPPMRALQSFCVINSQARLYGDAPLALVRQSGLLEYIKEEILDEDDDEICAICETKRKGDPEPKLTKFSVQDAIAANLWDKKGVWQQYPKRMLMYRARSFNLRDNFPDCFGGATIAEEYYGIETPEPSHQTTMPKRVEVYQIETEKPKEENNTELMENIIGVYDLWYKVKGEDDVTKFAEYCSSICGGNSDDYLTMDENIDPILDPKAFDEEKLNMIRNSIKPDPDPTVLDDKEPEIENQTNG